MLLNTPFVHLLYHVTSTKISVENVWGSLNIDAQYEKKKLFDKQLYVFWGGRREGERKGRIVTNFLCCFPPLNTLTNKYIKTFGLMYGVSNLFYRNLVLLCMALLGSLTKCSVALFLKSSKIWILRTNKSKFPIISERDLVHTVIIASQ